MEKRANIKEIYKWDLSAIVKDDFAWEDMFDKLSVDYLILGKYKGRLKDNSTIIECLKKEDELSEVLERLYVYARMRMDEDTAVSKYQSMSDKVEMLSVKISSLASYIVPELTKLSEDRLIELKDNENLSDFSYVIENIIKNKPHILSEAEERILSETGSFSDGFHDCFNMLDNVDIKFKPVKIDGDEYDMSHGTYGLYMQSQNRKLRKKAFDSMFNAFADLKNTFATLYSGNVKKNCFYARIRNFNSALEKSMFNENVSPVIYDNLVKSVHKSLPTLHKYVKYRKQALGFSVLNMWDMHTPIVEGEGMSLEYEDAYKLVIEALMPLGEEYSQLLKQAFNERWIDVYESKGKRSGAYSWGSYNAHPYVLLNYQKTTHDIFTIAHELGHAMHSYYSNKTQPHAKAGYEIFVAEVASTVNEVLMLKYLISKSEGKTKKYLLSYYLDMFRTTIFRQTQFAEFEKIAHETYEKGIPLTAQLLSDEYFSLNKNYYGRHAVSNSLIQYEWARIPHFYRSFYVYKYATGLTSAIVIANSILADNKNVSKYKQFLSLGGSMPPNEILKVAGVNLEEKLPFDIAMKEFENTLNELVQMED